MSEQRIDYKDLLLIYNLKQNSRLSLVDLGKKLDISPAAVTYRLNKLMEKNIIEQFTIKLNYDLLTPNYQIYQVIIDPLSEKVEELIQELDKISYFDRIIELASSPSLYGITLPLSSKNLKDLTKEIKSLGVIKFSIIPILNDFNFSSDEIHTDNISELYCTLCQKRVTTNEAIITQIENQTLSFCCSECKVQFTEQYSKIIGNENKE